MDGPSNPIAQAALGEPAGFEPSRCIKSDYLAHYEAECFEAFKDSPSFSFYTYNISLAANCIFLALFCLSLLGFIGVEAYHGTAGRRRNTMAFSVAMGIGATCEILGYGARIVSWKHPGEEGPFLAQIICLTVGPAYSSAGIYLCLRRVVELFGAEGSLIRPKWYTHMFIVCDAVSLLLQGAGGSIASAALHENRDKQPGTNVMIAGLVFQVFTLGVFLLLSAHFGYTTWRRHRGVRGVPVVEVDIDMVRLRGTRRFRSFLAALLVSTVCIFWRCIFRVAELSEGWSGPLTRRQDLFIAFEGAMIAVAVLAMNIFHPSFCMNQEPVWYSIELESNDKDGAYGDPKGA